MPTKLRSPFQIAAISRISSRRAATAPICLSWSSVNVSADETTGKDTILPRVGRSLAG
jgi:hypothetical protein